MPADLGMRSAVAGKPRVHELAKELGVESKTVLAKLQEMGEYVKSASSTIEAPVARRLRATMEAAAAHAAPTAPAAVTATAVDGKSGAKPAPPRKAAPAKKAPAPSAPVSAPTSAHDIEVAAAEVRAAALKAEQEAAVRAAQEANGQGPGDVRWSLTGPDEAFVPTAG